MKVALLFFVIGILGMIASLSGFVYSEPSMANLFIICGFFGMSGCMALVGAVETVKSKKK